MVNLDSEFRKLEADLTALFKKVIKDKGLIETGHLYNSISFHVENGTDVWNFKMTAMDYFKYVDEKYNITDTALSSPEYKVIQDKIAALYSEWLVEQLIETFNKQTN